MPTLTPVTIVVPVYGDWPSLAVCIASLVKHVPRTMRVMLVNDCGPDVDLMEQNIQRAIQGNSSFSYYRNDRNLGFVGTCNRAVLMLDTTANDILLLNSDTEVTEGFLETMQRVLRSDDSFATVSPRSNNATICTIPLSAINQKGIPQQKSYELFKKMKDLLPPSSVVPTAHGFCMLIRRDAIKQFGLFDEVFGKGYGEEVDLCQRLQEHGYKSVLANHAYVFHLEAKSFSLETKAELLKTNNEIIWERYPEYRKSVQTYVAQAMQAEGAIEKQCGYSSNAPTITRKLANKIKRLRPGPK